MLGLWEKYNKTNLILRIFIGLLTGVVLGMIAPKQLAWLKLLGDVFVGAMKGVAPVLVFVLVMSSLMSASKKIGSRFKTTVVLYVGSTVVAALVAVCASFMFPSVMPMNLASADNVVKLAPEGDVSLGTVDGGVTVNAENGPAISGVVQSIVQRDDAVEAIALVTQDSIGEVVRSMAMSAIASPIDAMLNANYIGILFWAVCLGLIMRNRAKPATKEMFRDISDGSLQLMYRIINFAPFGIIGLAFDAVASNSAAKLAPYSHLLLVLSGCMLFMGFVVNPLVAYLMIGKNPYPLVFTCLKRSAVTAFVTRSSAANVPVNMGLCRRLGLDEDVYSVTIPLGATIHMNGAAVTIVVMALSLAHTLGVAVSPATAVMLIIITTIGACGSSGVIGGSLFVLPMICKFLGIPNAYAMQAVGVGFIIAVIQDSFETALNSSGDVLITAVAEKYERKKNGEDFDLFAE